MPIKVRDEVQSQAAPLPGAGLNVNVTPEDVVGNLPAGVTAAAAAGAAVARKEKEEQDTARLQDTYSKLGQMRLEIQSTIAQQKGQDALRQNLEEQAGILYDQGAAPIVAELPEDLQKRFAGHVATERRTLLAAALEHTNTESQAVKDDSRRAAVATALKKAENATDPYAFEQAKAEGIMALDAGGGAHEHDKVAFLDSVEKLALGGQSRAMAVKLEAKYSSDPLGLKAAITEAEAIPNVKLADATVERLKKRQADLISAQGEFDKDALGRIVTRLENAKGNVSWATDPDYSKMSGHAKGMADEKKVSILLRQKAQDSEDRRARADARREQDDRNKIALDLFDSLSTEEKATVDLRTGRLPNGQPIDMRAAVAISGVDERGEAAIRAKQRGFKDVWDKGDAVAYEEFTKTIAAKTVQLDDQNRAKAIQKGMDDWYFAYRMDPKNHGRMPGGVEVAKEMANQFLMVRQSPDKYTVYPTKQTRAEFTAAGEDASKYEPLPPDEQFYGPSRELAATILKTPARPGAAAAPSGKTLAAPAVGPDGFGEVIPPDYTRPMVPTADGRGYMTEHLSNFSVDKNGQTTNYVIRQVYDGKFHEFPEALADWKAGKNPEVARFATEKEASTYAQARHEDQAVHYEAQRNAPVTSANQISAAERAQIEQAIRAGYQNRGQKAPAIISPDEIVLRYNLLRTLQRQ
jgi:hypothetical protein